MSKSEKGKETKASIISAARELFFEQGYHKTTTRQIAERANINLGLISYYFSSKSEIGAIIYQDIRDEMQNLIYNYHEEGTMMMFFLAMNADLYFLLKNEIYRNFYLDIAYEETILSYQRSVTEMVMKRYVNDKDSIQQDELILSCIGILAMKPEIIRVYTSNKYDISSQSVIRYFTKQFLINLGHSTDLCEDILDELSKYYIDIVDNFTPIITRIRT